MTRRPLPRPRRLVLAGAEYAVLRQEAGAVRLPPPFDRVPARDALGSAERAAAEARLRGADVLDRDHRCHPSVAASLLCHAGADVRLRADLAAGERVTAVRAAAAGLLGSVLEVTVTREGDQPRWVSPVTVSTCAVDDLVAETLRPLTAHPLGPGTEARSPETAEALAPADARRIEATLDLRVEAATGEAGALAWVRVDGVWWEPVARPEADAVHLDLHPTAATDLVRRVTAAVTRRMAQGTPGG